MAIEQLRDTRVVAQVLAINPKRVEVADLETGKPITEVEGGIESVIQYLTPGGHFRTSIELVDRTTATFRTDKTAFNIEEQD